MSKVLTDKARSGCYVIGDLNVYKSQETGTLASGNDCEAGTVLGRVTATDKLVPYNQDGADGSETPAGVLFANSDATDADLRVVFTARDQPLNGHELIWPDDITDAEKAAAEKAMAADLGLVVRY